MIYTCSIASRAIILLTFRGYVQKPWAIWVLLNYLNSLHHQKPLVFLVLGETLQKTRKTKHSVTGCTCFLLVIIHFFKSKYWSNIIPSLEKLIFSIFFVKLHNQKTIIKTRARLKIQLLVRSGKLTVIYEMRRKVKPLFYLKSSLNTHWNLRFLSWITTLVCYC